MVLVQRDACGCCPSLNHSRQIDWPLCDQEGLIIWGLKWQRPRLLDKSLKLIEFQFQFHSLSWKMNPNTPLIKYHYLSKNKLTSDSHEVLYRQGLLKGIRCLDPAEGLSPGQMQAIDRVYKNHPDLHDDEFVRTNLDRWLSWKGMPLIAYSNRRVETATVKQQVLPHHKSNFITA